MPRSEIPWNCLGQGREPLHHQELMGVFVRVFEINLVEQILR